MVTATPAAPARAPRLIPLFNPVAARLLRLGKVLGPNALLTVRGRKSGVSRTTPVALVELGGKRWVIGTFGDVNWVRNLRAARQAEISIGRQRTQVRATELTRDQAATFFAEVLAPYVSDGAVKRLMIRLLGAGEIVSNPRAAAAKRPVFELETA
jgi:deazaflavin-dependent oxidoreductase (nitroreductase family)